MPKPKISKSQPTAPAKPAVKAPQKPKETPQELIARAQKEVARIVDQMKGLATFCWNVDESQNEGLYDFSFALQTMLDCIADHAKGINETLALAAAEMQEGGGA